MNPDSQPGQRERELRDLLVATATATSSDRTPRGWRVTSSVVAFALAGALTGGAVSAAALTSRGDTDSSEPVSIEEMTDTFIRDDTRLFGTPYIVRSFGDTTIDLGSIPDGAAYLAVALKCLDAGTYDYYLDDERISSSTCTERDTDFGNGGAFFDVPTAGEHTLRIAADPDKDYILWASWATPALAPEPDEQQQAALADGAVTDAEYRAGFSTYSDCMANAGYPLVGVDTDRTIIEYSNTSAAVSSGAEQQCYSRHFLLLDMEWQVQNQQGD